MRRYVAVLVAAVLFLSAQGAAIDINDTDSLDYYSDSTLDFRVNPDGTIDAQGDIDLNGNRMSDSTGATTLDGNVSVPNGNLNVSTNDLLVAHSSGKVAFGATSNLGHVTVKSTSDTPRLGGIIFQDKDSTSNYHGFGLNSNNDLVFEYYDGGWNDGLRIKQGSGNVEIPNGNLSLGGDYLTSVGGIQDCTQNEFLNGNGNCQVDTDTDTDNQTLKDVLAQGNNASGYNINMSGGNITSDSEICAGNQCPA